MAPPLILGIPNGNVECVCEGVHVVCVCVWRVCSFVGGIRVRSAVCSVHGVFVCVCGVSGILV